MNWMSIQTVLQQIGSEFLELTEATEAPEIPLLRLLAVSYQIAAGETQGIIEMYSDAARFVGASEQQIVHARACGAKYRHQILVISRLAHLDEWTTHLRVFRAMHKFLETQSASGTFQQLPERIPLCVIQSV